MKTLQDSTKPKPNNRKINILKHSKKHKNKSPGQKLHKRSDKDKQSAIIKTNVATDVNYINDKQIMDYSVNISDNNFKENVSNIDGTVGNDKRVTTANEMNVIDNFEDAIKETLFVVEENGNDVQQSESVKVVSDEKKCDEPVLENKNVQEKLIELPNLTFKIVQKKVFGCGRTNKFKPLYEIVPFQSNKVSEIVSITDVITHALESDPVVSSETTTSKHKLKRPLKRNSETNENDNEIKKRASKNAMLTPVLNKLKNSLESLKKKNKPFLNRKTGMNGYNAKSTKEVTNNLLSKLCSNNPSDDEVEEIVSYNNDIKIVDVIGGYKSPTPEDDTDNFQFNEMPQQNDNIIVPTKTTDITKIKGWRNKKFCKNDEPENSGKTTANSNTVFATAFSSNVLDDYLIGNSDLNVSYDVPTLEAEETIEETHAVVDFPKLLGSIKAKPAIKKNKNAYKPRTLAEKRALLLQSEKPKNGRGRKPGKRKKKGKPAYMRKKYGNNSIQFAMNNIQYVENNSATDSVINSKPFKVPGKRGRKKLSNVNEKKLEEDIEPENIHDNIKKYEKPSLLNYMRYNFKQMKYNPADWETIEVNLPKIQLEVIPQIGKQLHDNIKHLVENGNPVLTADRVAFALSVLKVKSGVRRKQKFIFPVPYENNQTTVPMKTKKLPNVPPQHPPKVESQEDITKSVNEVVSKMLDYIEIADETINIIQEEADTRSESTSSPNNGAKLVRRKKRKFEGQSKSLHKTALEMKRLSCKIVSMPDEEIAESEPCHMEFCKMGCVCKTLECNIITQPHCGLVDCIFECACDVVASEIDSHQNVFDRLGDEAKKDLAKVEKEFTQTVIKTKDQLIIVNCNSRKRRATKFPKKYDDFIEELDVNIKAPKVPKIAPPANSPVIYGNIVTKPCYVKLMKYDFQHIVPFCMTHHVHNCPCDDTISVEYPYDDRGCPKPIPTSPDKSNNAEQKENGTARTRPLPTKFYHERNQSLNHKSHIRYHTQALQEKLKNYLREQSHILNNSKTSPTDNLQFSNNDVPQSQDNAEISTSSVSSETNKTSNERNRFLKLNNVLKQSLKENESRDSNLSTTVININNVLHKSSEDNNDSNNDRPNQLLNEKISPISFTNILSRLLEKDENDSKDSSENVSKSTTPIKPVCTEVTEKKLQRRKQKLSNKSSNEWSPFKSIFKTLDADGNVKEKFRAEFISLLIKSNQHLRLLPWSVLAAQYEQGACQLWFLSYKVPLILTETGDCPYSGFSNVKKMEQSYQKMQSTPSDIIYHLINKKVPLNRSGDSILLILALKKSFWKIYGICKKEKNSSTDNENPSNDLSLSLIEVFGGLDDFSKVNNIGEHFLKINKNTIRKVKPDLNKKIRCKPYKSSSILKPKNTKNYIFSPIDIEEPPNETITNVPEPSEIIELEGSDEIEGPSNTKVRDAPRPSKLQEAVEIVEPSKGNNVAESSNVTKLHGAAEIKVLPNQQSTIVEPSKGNNAPESWSTTKLHGADEVKALPNQQPTIAEPSKRNAESNIIKLHEAAEVNALPNQQSTIVEPIGDLPALSYFTKLQGAVEVIALPNQQLTKLQRPVEMGLISKPKPPKSPKRVVRIQKMVEIEGLLDVKITNLSGSATILQTITGHKGMLTGNSGDPAMSDKTKVTTLDLEKFSSIRLISEENSQNSNHDQETMWACLPRVTLACKWRVISTEKPFEYMTLTRNSFSVKYKDIQRLIKVAQVHGKTLILKSKLLQKHYFHRNFGMYCVANHSCKIFVGPYFLNEDPDIDVVTYINNTLVNTGLFSRIGSNKNLPGSGKWFHQVTNTEDYNDCDDLVDREMFSVIDLTDENDEEAIDLPANNSLLSKDTIENVDSDAKSIQDDSSDEDDNLIIDESLQFEFSEDDTKKIESRKFIITNVSSLGYMIMNIYDEKVEVICPATKRPKEFDNSDKAIEAVKGLFSNCFYTVQNFDLEVNLVDDIDKSVYKPFDQSILIGIHGRLTGLETTEASEEIAYVVGSFGVRSILNITPDELMELGLKDDHIANIITYPHYKSFITCLTYLGNLINRKVNINTLKSSTVNIIEEAISEINKLQKISGNLLTVKTKYRFDRINFVEKLSKLKGVKIDNFILDDIVMKTNVSNKPQTSTSNDALIQLKDSANTMVTSQDTSMKLKLMKSLLKPPLNPLKQSTIFGQNANSLKTLSTKLLQTSIQPNSSAKYVVVKNNNNNSVNILNPSTVQNKSKIIPQKTNVSNQSAVLVPMSTTKVPSTGTSNLKNLKFSTVPILSAVEFEHIKSNINKTAVIQQKPEASSSGSELQVSKIAPSVNSEHVFVIKHDDNEYYQRLQTMETPIYKMIPKPFKLINSKLKQT